MKRLCVIAVILLAVTVRWSMADNLSLSLADAVRIALEKSPDLKAAQARLDIAKATEQEAESEAGLQLTAHGMVMRTTQATMIPSLLADEPMVMFTFPAGVRSGGSAAAIFPLFTGGRISGELNSAAAGRQAEEFRFREARIQLAYAVKVAYYQILLAEYQTDVAGDVLAQDEETLRRIKALYDVGKTPEFNLFRAKAELAEAERVVVEAENDVALRKVNLLRILGLPLSASVEPSDKMEKPPEPAQQDALIGEALRQSPELQAQKEVVFSKESRVQAETGNYYPQIYAYGRMDGLSGSPGTFNGNSVGLVASLPLFDSGRRRGKVEEAKGELREARSNEEALTLDVSRDVTDAWLSAQTASKLLVEAEQGLTSAREDLRVVDIRFASGKGIHLEVLDATAAYSRARYRELEALYMAEVAQANLDRAIGKSP